MVYTILCVYVRLTIISLFTVVLNLFKSSATSANGTTGNGVSEGGREEGEGEGGEVRGEGGDGVTCEVREKEEEAPGMEGATEMKESGNGDETAKPKHPLERYTCRDTSTVIEVVCIHNYGGYVHMYVMLLCIIAHSI